MERTRIVVVGSCEGQEQAETQFVMVECEGKRDVTLSYTAWLRSIMPILKCSQKQIKDQEYTFQ